MMLLDTEVWYFCQNTYADFFKYWISNHPLKKTSNSYYQCGVIYSSMKNSMNRQLHIFLVAFFMIKHWSTLMLRSFLIHPCIKDCYSVIHHVLVSENKVLCHPSSVDSLSTSAGTEDHVSMGGWSARKAIRVVENVEQGNCFSCIVCYFTLCNLLQCYCIAYCLGRVGCYRKD